MPVPYPFHISVEMSERVKGVDSVGENRLRDVEILMLRSRHTPDAVMERKMSVLR